MGLLIAFSIISLSAVIGMILERKFNIQMPALYWLLGAIGVLGGIALGGLV